MVKVKKGRQTKKPRAPKLPKIDLREIMADIKRNKKERRKFLDYYAERIRQGTA